MLEDGTSCQFSMWPPQKSDLQEVLSLREDMETGGTENRKGEPGWRQDALLLCHGVI